MLKKIKSISLIVAILISTTGYALNKHYCQGKLQSVSITLGNDINSCCDDEENMPSGCCDNDTEVFQLDTEYAKASFELSFDKKFIQAPFFTLHEFLAPDFRKESQHFSYKEPPLLLQQDLPVLLQSFLL